MFSLGQVVATPGALAALNTANQTALEFLQRHSKLEPGELSKSDQKANRAALDDGSRILSSFKLADGTKLWIITEATGDDGQRASTCCLLPEEY